MNHFQAVRLLASGVLEQTDLRALGKINVVCGRNNSGKSTLLAALPDRAKRARGIILEPDQVTELIDATLNSAGLIQRRAERQALTEIVAGSIARQAIWYTTDIQAWAESLSAQIQNTPVLKRHPIRLPGVVAKFNGLFGAEPEIIFVPPKRTLQLQAGLSTGENLDWTGAGLLNYLFYAKNQPLDSIDYKVDAKVSQAFARISGGYTYQIIPNRSNVIAISFAPPTGSWVNADACGLGLQDLLVILYFATHPTADVVLIEEPESHLHPDMQRKLLYFLREETDKQFFLSTHSNVFVNNALADRVFLTIFDRTVKVDEATSRASMLDDLGYSVTDNLVSDLVILVEGPTDVPVVEELLSKFRLSPRYDIRIWPLGGDIMDQLDLSVFIERYTLHALLDRDPGSGKSRKRFMEKCAAVGIPVHQLQRRSIENYFPLHALRSVFHAQIGDDITELDPTRDLKEQIGINVKHNNRAVARVMNIEDVANTDLAEFFSQIERTLIGITTGANRGEKA